VKVARGTKLTPSESGEARDERVDDRTAPRPNAYPTPRWALLSDPSNRVQLDSRLAWASGPDQLYARLNSVGVRPVQRRNDRLNAAGSEY
jgi:hypothetical protein